MKRFNYTGRKKILRDDVKIRLQGSFNQTPMVDAALNLSDYEFPPKSCIFLEPQSKTRFMRIELGEVASSVRRNGIELTEFDDAIDLDFRVKVVDTSKGLLLGIAENVRAYSKDDQLNDNQKSILPVSSVDLSSHGVLWRVVQDDVKAVLEIERELGSRDQVVRSLMFRAFVLPAAMRQILVQLLSDDAWDSEFSDPHELSTRWLLFARQIGAGVPEKETDKVEWIDNAVRILASRIGVRQEAIMASVEGAWR
ncbi:conserved hypothetical protein [Burkholderia sp. 8Y]|uniref:hypothetical protein n=1 Tax=Burkholderia sp. 8Y TaxID=2653133 RepID=UPI0012F11018|nr:hypothetical protein [Burkholderia sp. 8Y]VXC60194.1 conserved hypothetical protein [Burkholderia sp. 8Y]